MRTGCKIDLPSSWRETPRDQLAEDFFGREAYVREFVGVGEVESESFFEEAE